MKSHRAIRQTAMIVLTIASLSFFSITASALPSTGPTKPAELIRVGITEYQNIEATYRKYEVFFRELASYADANEPVSFSIAIGTYGEVLDWYNNRTIDIAVLSAMPTAQLLLLGEVDNLRKAYLGDLNVTFQKDANEQSLIDLFPSADNTFVYRPGCIVLNSDHDIDSFDKIKRLSKEDKVKFLFVRPYSLSGYIAPIDILQKSEINPLAALDHNKEAEPQTLEFTYQHDKSLETMIKSLDAGDVRHNQHLVAFVLDDTRYKTPDNLKSAGPIFKRIEFPELDTFRIPREIIVANYHQDDPEQIDANTNKFIRNLKIMKGLLERWNAQRRPAAKSSSKTNPVNPGEVQMAWRDRPDTWVSDYDQIRKALDRTNLPKQLLYKSSIDDLLKDLTNMDTPPRLALVLSGGGAKCAYQAGAIIAIEQKIRDLNEALEKKYGNKSKNIDINLVVGTSGGAINALLVALGVTSDPNARDRLRETWQSFRQQHFLQPSRRFNLLFGICFFLLQSLLIVVAVLLFDRDTMNWPATLAVLFGIGVVELLVGLYFRFNVASIGRFMVIQLVAVAAVIVAVVLVDAIVQRITFFCKIDDHWRRLTVFLMLVVGFLEVLIAKIASLDTFVEGISQNHWVEHLWTLIKLVSVWSFPYPFLLALAVTLIGWRFKPKFDWDKWREPAVFCMAILLIAVSIFLLFETLFRQSSPSRSIGIEEAFVRQIPVLLQRTIDPTFNFEPSGNDSALHQLSSRLMSSGYLKRDLVITTSKLPVRETQAPLPVNSLPDDLYFYFSSNKQASALVPADKHFVPLKHNEEKLLDVVIGSSTIYPIFSPRRLKSVWLGTESSRSGEAITDMRIIDGGFIHNTPIQAARLWKATHIILIDASPTPQLRDPRDLWDNSLLALGYLFSQAQKTDTVMRAGTFELRPTSKCEKWNVKPVCTDSDGAPEPNMDTFDFSNRAARDAFEAGKKDVNSLTPLFVRVPGPPIFRDVAATPSP